MSEISEKKNIILFINTHADSTMWSEVFVAVAFCMLCRPIELSDNYNELTIVQVFHHGVIGLNDNWLSCCDLHCWWLIWGRGGTDGKGCRIHKWGNIIVDYMRGSMFLSFAWSKKRTDKMYCICQRVTALKKLSTSLIQELVYIMEYDLVHYEIRIDKILKHFLSCNIICHRSSKDCFYYFIKLSV